ncbi:hypothetical protein [Nannocystis pusilla]|uniref:hypothetical protein n=1 Tax=Nannocystis pusilla TaxID=889268 RepID=UPI003DA2B7FC
MSDAEEIEMEAAPETASYRHHHRMTWQSIRSRYAEALGAAKSRGLADEPASKTAALTVRGAIRALMSELLTRSPVPAILEFLAVGLEWGEAGERILEQQAAVLGLIESAYPRPTWTKLEPLDREAAEDDARWFAWTTAWTEAFGATSPAAQAALARDTASLQGSEMKVSTSPRRWAPWLTSAAVIVVATTGIAMATRE